MLFEIFGARAAEHAAAWFSAGQLDTLTSALMQHVNAPRTSSMGRLFDAVAAICGLPPVITFEGQAAMALEFAADENEKGAYPLPIRDAPDRPLVFDGLGATAGSPSSAGDTVGQANRGTVIPARSVRSWPIGSRWFARWPIEPPACP